MALVGPVLDDRTFAQLRDELVRRITVFTPEWTDHNPTDPGIALLELFAHLGESLLFRFNQIPDATKVAFLRLLGVQARPAQVARTLLAVQTERPDGVAVRRGAEARAGTVLFETADEVVAWPLDVVAVGRQAVPETADKAEQRRRADAVARLDDATRDRIETAGRTFYTLAAVPADPTAPDATPLDVAATVDGALWVALLATPTTDVTRLRGRSIFLGVAFDEQVQPQPFDLVPAAPTAGVPAPPGTLLRAADLTTDPPAVVWELWKGPDRTGFTPLGVPVDTTRGLTTTGVVMLDLPADFPTHAPGVVPAGDATTPPPLDDTAQAQRVVGWLRGRRPQDENDAIHRVRWVGQGAVEAVQSRAAGAELLGTGSGDPGQTFTLTQRPVIAGSVALEVEEPSGWTRWTEVADFIDSTLQDRHFTVDTVSGLVHFGTDRTRLPQLGERIRVTGYRHGGGAAGNVAAGAITALSEVAGVKVTNVLPAAGGADAATLAEALEEIPAEVHRRDRAVTPDDFRALTLRVPGVVRAEPLATFHPDTPTQPAAGVVTVVVFPAEDRRRPDAPEPDLALLRRAAAFLNARRLVTTELYVVPPTYRPIAVAVGVRVRDGYQVDAVRRWVELIVRQYLAPVPPFGPDGDGWPLGRTVRRAELHAVAVQVDGVEFVEDLRLAAVDAAGKPTPADDVALRRWEVPRIATITVVPGRPLAPGAGYDLPAPGPKDPVLVVLPPDVC